MTFSVSPRHTLFSEKNPGSPSPKKNTPRNISSDNIKSELFKELTLNILPLRKNDEELKNESTLNTPNGTRLDTPRPKLRSNSFILTTLKKEKMSKDEINNHFANVKREKPQKFNDIYLFSKKIRKVKCSKEWMLTDLTPEPLYLANLVRSYFGVEDFPNKAELTYDVDKIIRKNSKKFKINDHAITFFAVKKQKTNEMVQKEFFRTFLKSICQTTQCLAELRKISYEVDGIIGREINGVIQPRSIESTFFKTALYFMSVDWTLKGHKFLTEKFTRLNKFNPGRMLGIVKKNNHTLLFQVSENSFNKKNKHREEGQAYIKCTQYLSYHLCPFVQVEDLSNHSIKSETPWASIKFKWTGIFDPTVEKIHGIISIKEIFIFKENLVIESETLQLESKKLSCENKKETIKKIEKALKIKTGFMG